MSCGVAFEKEPGASVPPYFSNHAASIRANRSVPLLRDPLEHRGRLPVSSTYPDNSQRFRSTLALTRGRSLLLSMFPDVESTVRIDLHRTSHNAPIIRTSTREQFHASA